MTITKKKLWEVMTSNRDCEDCLFGQNGDECVKHHVENGASITVVDNCAGCYRYNIKLFGKSMYSNAKYDFWEPKP